MNVVSDEMVEALRTALDAAANKDRYGHLIADDYRAALTAALAAMWRPIEEAPDDLREILVFGGQYKEPTIVKAEGDWWRTRGSRLQSLLPTHFAPLLPPPDPR